MHACQQQTAARVPHPLRSPFGLPCAMPTDTWPSQMASCALASEWRLGAFIHVPSCSLLRGCCWQAERAACCGRRCCFTSVPPRHLRQRTCLLYALVCASPNAMPPPPSPSPAAAYGYFASSWQPMPASECRAANHSISCQVARGRGGLASPQRPLFTARLTPVR